MERERLVITPGSDGELVLAGDLDAYSAPRLSAEVASIDGPDVRIVMSEVTFMDSSGLRVVVATDNDARERGGRLSIVAPSPSVRRLLELTAVNGHLRVEPGPG